MGNTHNITQAICWSHLKLYPHMVYGSDMPTLVVLVLLMTLVFRIIHQYSTRQITAPDSSLVVRGRQYISGYYLMDEIYPERSVLLKLCLVLMIMEGRDIRDLKNKRGRMWNECLKLLKSVGNYLRYVWLWKIFSFPGKFWKRCLVELVFQKFPRK